MFAASKTASVSGGYQISRSLRFNSADTAYLGRTPASASNQQKWTWSGWVKRTGLGSVTLFGGGTSGSAYTELYYSNDTLFFYNNLNSSAAVGTAGVYRDVSAWYHVVCAVDTTQATASNRIKLYVNGSQPTLTTTTYPAQNTNMHINSASVHSIGVLNYTAGFLEYFNGQMTEINFIDGQALAPSSFGETNAQTGVWQPKAYSGSYGTNGFYLNFSDNSNTTAATLGKDYSGNGNNWTPNNFSVTAGVGNDSLVDSPTSYGTDTGVGGTVRGNYCTFNPLQKGADVTLTDGNLKVVGGYACKVLSTIGMSSGTWYCEMVMNSGTNANFGLARFNTTFGTGNYLGDDTTSWCYATDGKIYTNGTGTVYGNTYTVGDVIGISFDADVGTLKFYKNGTVQNSGTAAVTGLTSGPYFFAQGASSSNIYANFGQRPFAYTAPSGFKALCTQNLPTPTIGATTATLASKYFAPTLYTGNGTSQTITTGFMPNLVWIKSRSNAQSHFLHNNVDNVSLYLSSNNTSAEGYDTTTVTAISSTGFSLGTESNHNGNGNTYVAWGWNASGSSGGTTNTAGSITSTVSANTTSGFSIITWTGNATQGATIGHGLGAVPALFIIKNRSTGATNWPVKTNQLSTNSYLVLNGTGGAASYSFFWPNDPTSSIIYLGSDADVNGNGNSMICYAFAEVAGYSKFGSYTGNGSADGTFIYMGFRPAYVLIKRTDTGGYDWWIMDATRSPANAVRARLYTNDSAAESSNDDRIDFVSNGIKIRNSDAGYNASGGTYIYACFASNPFKYSLAR